MKQQDELAEFFKDKFDNFEPQVPSNAWNGIKSELNSIPSASATQMSKTGFSTLAKVSAAVVGTALVAVTAIVLLPNNHKQNPPISATHTQIDPESENQPIGNTIQESDALINEEFDYPVKEESIDPQQLTSKDDNAKTEPKMQFSSSAKATTNLQGLDGNANQTSTPVESEVTSSANNLSIEENQLAKEEVLVIEQHIPKIISEQSQEDNNTFRFYGVEDLAQVKWQFGDEAQSTEISPTHRYNQPGEYVVTLLGITKDGKSVLDKAKVVVGPSKAPNQKNYTITIPNVITPDGDGVNDKFVIQHENISQALLNIYNIAGQLVYTSDNINRHWDGHDSKGDKLNKATYFYVINIIDNQGNSHIEKGYITIF